VNRSVRSRLDRLAVENPCSACSGTGVGLRSSADMKERIEALIEKVHTLKATLREDAAKREPHERTAGQWSALDSDTVTTTIMKAALDRLADLGDARMVATCRRYLDAIRKAPPG
jgi:hypothetical protein